MTHLPDEIDPRIASLYEVLDLYFEKIHEAQASCSHPKETLSKIPKGSTGNWDRDSDSYWYDCHCLRCNKRWREDQ